MISKVEIGRQFEAEVFKVLVNFFERVEWLSKENIFSSVDFKCHYFKKCFYIEAKKNPNNCFIDGCYDRDKINLFATNIDNKVTFLLPRKKGETLPISERVTTLNQAVVDLIEKEVKKK